MVRRKQFARGRFALAALAILGLFAFQAWAKPVAKEQAASAVAGWLQQPGHGLAAPLGKTVKETQTFLDAAGQSLFYVVYLKPSGFVIVPAEDLVEPIIAFSPGVKFINSDADPLGALVRHDLAGRVAAARVAPQAALAPRRIAAQAKWARLKSVAAAPAAAGLSGVSDLRVAPLTQTTWSQDVAGDDTTLACYNYYTPPGPDGNQNNYPCGCVATAMAQLMYFWQYPTVGVGTGSFTIYVNNRRKTANLLGGDGVGGAYQWSLMPLSPDASITSAQQQQIGALCFDSGVALGYSGNPAGQGMDYEASGSGAYLSDAAHALQTTFMYGNVISAVDDAANDNYVNTNIGAGLIGMINPNLDAGFPAILGITGPDGGHAVVADGYGYDTGTLYHHLNMGWSGDDNAWYNLPNIDADAQDVFNVIDNCLYNIYVTGVGEIISGRVVDTNGNAISGVTVTAAGTSGTTYSSVATTNAEGIYAFPKVPSGGTFTLTASAPNRYFLGLTETTGASVSGTASTDAPTSGNVWGANFTDLGAPPTGNLKVTLLPAAAAAAGAAWNVDGGQWQASGATVTGLSLGGHSVNFGPATGWNAPQSTSVTIAYNTTSSVTGTYTQQTGQVQVTINPSGAVSAGAQWNVDGGAWQASGATLSGVTVGNHTVNFETVYGWNAPAAVPVSVTYNGLATTSGTYTVQLGNLTITLQPAGAVAANAQWRVDGGAWQASGATVTGLTVAAHTVDYANIIAYAPPPSETVNILNNQTVSLTRSYVVDLTPPSVNVSSLDPAAGAWCADTDALIALHVTDAGAGVDYSTVTIQASRDNATWQTVYSGATAALAAGGWYSYNASANTLFPGEGYSVGTPADYLFLFQPAAPFDYQETVYIQVSATDLAGNVMTPYTYSFTTQTRSFGYPVRVDGGTVSNDQAAAATDAAGNVWVAWTRTNPATSATSLWLAERPSDACAFGPETQVASVAANPRLAIAQNGVLYLAWTTPGAQVYAASATTAAPAPLNSLGIASSGALALQSVTAMTVDSRNNLYVAGLLDDSHSVPQVAVAELPSSNLSWIVTQVTSGGAAKGAPAIARDSSNVIYLVWANTADNNLYGADSSSWTTIHQVTSAGNASQPAMAAESSGNVLHFIWAATGGAPNPNILHAQTAGGWPSAPLAGASVLDGTTGIFYAGNPTIAVIGTTNSSGNAKLFALWQDQRAAAAGAPNDTDIMFAESNWQGAFGTNILVSRLLAGQPAVTGSMNPAIGLANGAPYAAWTEAPAAGAGHIYFAAAMQQEAFGAPWLGVTSSGGAQSFTDAANPHFTEVDLSVPTNALNTPRNFSVFELLNPVVPCPGGTGLYNADGSGLYLAITGGDDQALGGWVTVTIHLNTAQGVTLPSPLTVYRLVPPATALDNWTWTTALIQNVSYNAAAGTLTFQTMHLSTFGAGVAPTDSSGGGGGGGCAMSPGGEPDLFILLLPLAALGLGIAPRLKRAFSSRI